MEETIWSALRKQADRIGALRDELGGQPAGREFALAYTALEDACMRVNRGMAHLQGRFADADVEAMGGLGSGVRRD